LALFGRRRPPYRVDRPASRRPKTCTKPGSRRAIDHLAKEGALFTDVYAQQSCAAGRSSFILGEHLGAFGGSTIVLICEG
jgi:arylsulfatase A-like enzyme